MRKLFAAMAIMVASTTWSANAPTLKIGDPAPPLRPMQWLKGEPVERFEKGRFYIVEFWATWCGPCIQAMPHLSELAKKYADRVSVIGVSVREGEKGATVTVADVQQFVDRKGEKMSYVVAMDDPKSNTVFKHWLSAAGLFAIPTAFLVDGDGRIAWIGYPQKLDAALAALVDHSTGFDAADAATQLAKDQAREAQIRPMYEALKRGDYAAAWAEASARMRENPKFETAEFWSIMVARVNVDTDGALSYTKEKAADSAFLQSLGFTGGRANENFLDSVAAIVANQNGLKSNAYRFAVDQLEKAVVATPKTYHRWNALAQARAHLHDFKGAVVAQERAISLFEELSKDQQDMLEQSKRSMTKQLTSYRSGRLPEDAEVSAKKSGA